MKHTKLAGILLASIAFLSIGTAVGVTSFNNTKEVDAASQSDIDTYYYNVSGKDTALLNSINSVIRSVNRVGYSGLQEAYRYTDVRADGKLYDLYSDCTQYTPGSAFVSQYSDVGDGYNREHTIPQSWWGEGTSYQGCDLFIVLPSDGKANGMRSNYPYGETDSDKTYKMANDPDGNALGTSNNTNWVSGTVFEPFDDRKGDLARIYFYAVAMYSSGGSSQWADKNKSVYEWTSGYGSSVFSNSGKNGFVQKYLNMLLKWHKDDPVSQWEITRNDNVQGQQGNRNPFIDHPSWVDLIWGGTYAGANAEDTSSGSVDHGKLISTGITSISKTEAALSVGGTTTISATSSNSGNITWTSSAPSVATVSPGTQSSGSNVTITAVTTGSATITASITISGTTYSKICEVTVSDPSQVTLSSISVSGQKTAFTVGDAFSFGGTVTANYSDSSTQDVTASASFSGYNMSSTGNQTVTVSYGGKTTNYSITVSAAVSTGDASLYSGTITEGDYVIVYDGKAMMNTISSNRLTYSTVTVTNDVISSPNSSIVWHIAPSGNYWTIYNASVSGYAAGTGANNKAQLLASGTDNKSLWTVSGTSTYEFVNKGNAASSVNANLRNNGTYGFACYSTGTGGALSLYKVQAAATKTLSSISLDTTNVQKSFTVGATFNYTGLVVSANYSDSTSATVTPTSVSTPDMSTSGQKTVTVSYTEGEVTKTNTYNITVNAKTLSSISISGQTTSFYEGDTFAFGGTVTAHYSDSSTENVTSSATFSGYTMTTTGQQTVTVSYGGESTSYSITINAGLLDSIILSGQKTSYKVNDEFSFTGTCTAVFENEYEKSVTPTSVSSPDMSSAGDKTVTVSYTYNGRTRSTSYTISVSSSTYTGLLEEGRYYIMNEDKTRGLNAAYSNASPSAISLASSNSLTAFDFTLVGNNLYSISVTVNTSTYNLVCNTTAATSNNTNIRVINSFADNLKSIYWSPEAIDNEDTYYLKENTTGTTYRYLSYFTDNSTKYDWRGYVNTSNGQPKINFVKEGSLAEGIANRILNDVTCDNGVTAPSTSDWSSVSTAYSALTITYEKNLLINGVANEQSTNVIEQALAKYDLIIRRYGSSTYSNFLGRNISQAHNIVYSNLTDNSSLIVILIATGIVGVGFVSPILLKRRKHY